MPTLRDLCGLEPIAEDKLKRGPIDGETQHAFWAGEKELQNPSTHFVHVQRKPIPPKWDRSVAMTEQWRLVNGEALYDITKDPGQQNDIAADHPEVVKQLRADYETWWASLKPSFDTVVRFDLGGAQNPTTLMSHDWFMQEGEGDSAWHHVYVQRNELRNGPFMVTIKKAGRYRITPMRWPEYVDKRSGCIATSVEFTFEPKPKGEGHPLLSDSTGRGLDPNKPAKPLETFLPAGLASLTTTLTREDGKTFGAYYVKIEYLGEEDDAQ